MCVRVCDSTSRSSGISSCIQWCKVTKYIFTNTYKFDVLIITCNYFNGYYITYTECKYYNFYPTTLIWHLWLFCRWRFDRENLIKHDAFVPQYYHLDSHNKITILRTVWCMITLLSWPWSVWCIIYFWYFKYIQVIISVLLLQSYFQCRTFTCDIACTWVQDLNTPPISGNICSNSITVKK